MQYPLLISLETISLLATLFFGMLLFYLLVKKWQEKSFKQCLGAFILYELASFLIYLVLSKFVVTSKIVSALIFAIVLFSIFYILTKKLLSLSWKKSFIAFLLVILITLPAIDFFILKLKVEIIKLPIFAKENIKMQNEIIEYFKEPEIFKVFSKI